MNHWVGKTWIELSLRNYVRGDISAEILSLKQHFKGNPRKIKRIGSRYVAKVLIDTTPDALSAGGVSLLQWMETRGVKRYTVTYEVKEKEYKNGKHSKACESKRAEKTL